MLFLEWASVFEGIGESTSQAGIKVIHMTKAASTPAAVSKPNSCRAGIPVKYNDANPMAVVMLVSKVANPVSKTISLRAAILSKPRRNSSRYLA